MAQFVAFYNFFCVLDYVTGFYSINLHVHIQISQLMRLVLILKINIKFLIFSYQSVLTFVLGARKNRLIVLLSTHNLCFG